MKTKSVTENNIFRAAAVTVAVLMIPAVGLQVSQEWFWDSSDFLIMGVLIFCFGMFFQWATKNAGKKKILVGVGIILAFLYVWAELAVGIFTNLGS